MKIFRRLKPGVPTLPFFTLVTLLLAGSLFNNSANCQPPEMCKLSIQLLLNTNGGSSNTADGCVILFANSFQKSIGQEDSYKFTNLDENLAVDCGGTMLSMEGRPTIVDNDTVPLKLWQYRQNDYFFKFVPTNFPGTVTAFIKDNYLHTDTPVDLGAGTLVPFSLTADSASMAPDRFCMIFKKASTLSVGLSGFRAYEKNQHVQLEWTAVTDINVNRYEIEKSLDGIRFIKAERVSIKESSSGNKYEWIDKSVVSGLNYYRVATIEKSGNVSYTNVVQVQMKKSPEVVSIFPNPATGGTVTVNLTNLQPGHYSSKLFDLNGSLKQIFTFKHSSSVSVHRLKIITTPGLYKLMTEGNGKKFNNIIVVQ